jgi:hypothetical protein
MAWWRRTWRKGLDEDGVHHRDRAQRPWSIIFLREFLDRKRKQEGRDTTGVGRGARAHIYILMDCETVERLREFNGG